MDQQDLRSLENEIGKPIFMLPVLEQHLSLNLQAQLLGEQSELVFCRANEDLLSLEQVITALYQSISVKESETLTLTQLNRFST